MSQFELVRILHALCYPTTVGLYDERSEFGRSGAVPDASYRIIRTLDLGLLPRLRFDVSKTYGLTFFLYAIATRTEQDGTECVTVLRVKPCAFSASTRNWYVKPYRTVHDVVDIMSSFSVPTGTTSYPCARLNYLVDRFVSTGSTGKFPKISSVMDYGTGLLLTKLESKRLFQIPAWVLAYLHELLVSLKGISSGSNKRSRRSGSRGLVA